jgi:hypothetical protein
MTNWGANVGRSGARSFASRWLVALCVVAALAPLAGCSDEEGSDSFASVSEGQLLVTPDVVTFSGTPIGQTASERITLINVGEGPLTISEASLSTSNREFGLGEVSFPIVLQPGDERVIDVTYTPTDCNQDRGSIVVVSNDRQYSEDGGRLNVPLQPQPLTGQVRINPNPVDFGRVPAGTCRAVEVSAVNSGTCALTIGDLFIAGSADFEFTDTVDGTAVPSEPELPFTLEPSETRAFEITYCPENDGFDEANMVVRSDDAANRTMDVPLLANGDQACIIVSDEDGVNFGQRFIGETHPKTITITNCSQSEDLIVSGIGLSEHFETLGYERFSMTDLPELPLTLAAQDSYSFILNYTPILYTPADRPSECDDEEGCELSDAAMLTVTSNDEVKSPLEIEVFGIGTNNHCPVAVGRMRVQGGSNPWDVQLDAIPLQTLEFDGRNSTDSEGPIAQYVWEVERRPDGSTARFNPGPNVANPTFFLDLAGEYRFRLRVFDEQGVESCDSAELLAIVTPDEAIHVQLVWTTDGDPNALDDNGTDVDLHFLHPNGDWGSRDWDCHWQARSPNWGSTSTDEDDPSLDIDDTGGWGPENINLNQPEGTAVAPIVYQVGVFYFSDHGFGPSDSTVRIYLDGIERFALTFPNLENRQFWHVANIEWPTREIERIHRLYPSGFP